MIKRELKDVIESLLFCGNNKELIQCLYRRFELLLLHDINIDDYEKINEHLYAIRDFIGSED